MFYITGGGAGSSQYHSCNRNQGQGDQCWTCYALKGHLTACLALWCIWTANSQKKLFVKPCFPLIFSCWLLLSVRAQHARSLSRFWEVTASVQASTGETAVGFMTEGPCLCCRDSSLYYCKLNWSVTHLKVLTLSLRCSPKINTHAHTQSVLHEWNIDVILFK